MTALADYEVDLVLVFRPPFLANFQPLMTLEQRLVAVMPADHPLAGRRNRAAARLRRAIRSRCPSAASAAGNCSTRSARAADLRFRSPRESNSFELLREPGDARPS